jgi:aspartyl-tRNA(Asn)/glutamyl-tRNA(Gln) amidotransferase subunit C
MRIENYASMAKVSLSESEQAKITEQSNMLIDSFGALESINTDGVAVQFTVLDIKNVFRDDVVSKNVSRETLLSNAPEQYGGYFQAPKTID